MLTAFDPKMTYPAVALFGLGLIFGSFSSMLRHRLPRRMSVLGPRSECHRCQHPLGPADLVPLLSWLWLRGKCRYCRVSIPWTYPLNELACGLTAGLAAAVGGWGAGYATLGLWVSATVLLGFRKRKAAEETGSTLVEVLIAMALLSAVLVPMLDFGANMRSGATYPRQVAVSLAASKLEDLGNRSYRTPSANWPSSGWEQAYVGQYIFDLEWTVSGFSPADNDFASEASFLRTAKITVTCSAGCPTSMPPVRMVTVLGKLQL